MSRLMRSPKERGSWYRDSDDFAEPGLDSALSEAGRPRTEYRLVELPLYAAPTGHSAEQDPTEGARHAQSEPAQHPGMG